MEGGAEELRAKRAKRAHDVASGCWTSIRTAVISQLCLPILWPMFAPMTRSVISRGILAVSGLALLGMLGVLIDVFLDVGRRFPHLALGSRLFLAEQREEACKELLRRDDRSAVPLLMRALSDPEWRVAMSAKDALAELGDRSLMPELLRIAADLRSENGRMYAISALGDHGDASVVPFLITCLSDPHTLIQRNAAGSLGQLRATKAVEPLMTVLKDPAFMYRSSAAWALGKIGDLRAFDALVAMLERETDEHQADSAAEALGMLGDRRAVPILLAYIRDARLFVALDAIKALGNLKDPSAVAPLCALILEPGATHDHLNAAATALAAIGDPRAISVLRGVSTGRPEPLFARGRLGDATVQGELRDHTDGAIRHQAWTDWQARESCIALGACGDATDIGRLETLARKGDKAMRAAAEEGLVALRRRIAGSAPAAP